MRGNGIVVGGSIFYLPVSRKAGPSCFQASRSPGQQNTHLWLYMNRLSMDQGRACRDSPSHIHLMSEKGKYKAPLYCCTAHETLSQDCNGDVPSVWTQLCFLCLDMLNKESQWHFLISYSRCSDQGQFAFHMTGMWSGSQRLWLSFIASGLLFCHNTDVKCLPKWPHVKSLPLDKG